MWFPQNTESRILTVMFAMYSESTILSIPTNVCKTNYTTANIILFAIDGLYQFVKYDGMPSDSINELWDSRQIKFTFLHTETVCSLYQHNVLRGAPKHRSRGAMWCWIHHQTAWVGVYWCYLYTYQCVDVFIASYKDVLSCASFDAFASSHNNSGFLPKSHLQVITSDRPDAWIQSSRTCAIWMHVHICVYSNPLNRIAVVVHISILTVSQRSILYFVREIAYIYRMNEWSYTRPLPAPRILLVLSARSDSTQLNATGRVESDRALWSCLRFNSTELDWFQLVRASFASSEHFAAGRVEFSWVVDTITTPDLTKLRWT